MESQDPLPGQAQESQKGEWYSIYLTERKENEGSSAFFLDVSDFFLEKKQPGLALRILSNVAEMELENPQLLRILGYRLMQIGRPKLAVAVFEEVLKMREEEPQSYRDLALALAADKQHQRAVDLLRQVVEGKWNGRFPEIELTALNEMNAIIATCGKGACSGQPRQTFAQEPARGRPGHPDLGCGQHRHGSLGDRSERGKVLLQSP